MAKITINHKSESVVHNIIRRQNNCSICCITDFGPFLNAFCILAALSVTSFAWYMSPQNG